MFVVLTALQIEYKAVRRHMTGLHRYPHRAGTVFEIGVLAEHPDKQVAIAVLGPGNHAAAALTERAITEFRPEVVMFAGIAGALRDWLCLGDVVVATKVYGYHGGTGVSQGFQTSPQAWALSHALEQAARHLDVSDAWRSALPPQPGRPQVHFQPVVAGEVVLKSARSGLAQRLRDHYSDAVAIEMESAGVAHASHLNMSQPVITIRGISDFANEGKDLTDLGGAPALAAGNAAAFAVSLIAGLEDRASAVHNTVSHPATFVAQVGMAGRGPSRDGSNRTAGSLTFQLLYELTQAVVAEYEADHLDEQTFNLGVEVLFDARGQVWLSAHQDAVRRLDELLGHRPRLRAIIDRIRETL